MAVIKFHPDVAPRLGHKGGTVFSRNSSGFIATRRRKPLYKLTPKVSEIRSKLRYVQGQWRLLSPAQQQTFWDERLDYIRVNPAGKVLIPDGPQLHGRLNQPLAVSNLPLTVVANPAISFPVRLIDPSIFTLSPFRLWVYLNDLSIPAGFNLKIWCGPVDFGERQRTFPGNFTLVETFDVSQSPYYDVTSSYVQAFGPTPAINFQFLDSTFIAVAIQLIHISDGQQALIDQTNIPLFFF